MQLTQGRAPGEVHGRQFSLKAVLEVSWSV